MRLLTASKHGFGRTAKLQAGLGTTFRGDAYGHRQMSLGLPAMIYGERMLGSWGVDVTSPSASHFRRIVMNSDQENDDSQGYIDFHRLLDGALRKRLEDEGQNKWVFRDMAEEAAESLRKYPEAHEKLASVASGLRSSTPVLPVRVRQLLQWFGAERRGPQVNPAIRLALELHKLHIAPDLNAVSLDAPISFRPGIKPTIEYPEGYTPRTVRAGVHHLDEVEASLLNEIWKERISDRLIGWVDEHPGATREEIQAKLDELAKLDSNEVMGIRTPIPTPRNPSRIAAATFRVNELGAANTKPPSISPNDTIVAATTLMDQRGLSRLLVVSGRTLKGTVSWHSIGSWLLHGGNRDAEVRHCMEPPLRELRDDAPLLEAIDEVERHQCVVIRNSRDSGVGGIITASDIVRDVMSLSEPFLLLMQIENHVRGLILDGRFTVEDLRDVKDGRDSNRYVRHVDDLTLGEYLDLLNQEGSWQKLGLSGVDRRAFTSQLDHVRRIRNAVMHFKLDPIRSEELQILHECAKYLQTIRSRT